MQSNIWGENWKFFFFDDKVSNNFLSSPSVDLFKDYITPKDSKNAPKKFTDCQKLFSECRAPNEHPIGIKKRRKPLKEENETTYETPVEDTTTPDVDIVTQYVKQRKN